MPDSGKSLLSARETATMLGMSVATVWRRTHDGTLPEPVRIGGMTRWVREELIKVISAAQARREDRETTDGGTSRG
jgi:predicted DNA-binding transcriptional regulator AlpA